MGLKDAFKKLLVVDDTETTPYTEGNDMDPSVDYPDDGYSIPDSSIGSGLNSNVSVTSGSSIEMVVVKPEKLGSVTQIADYLVDRKTILLNLEETNKDTARRLIDFLNGVAYAISGNLRKVATNTYVVTPSNVELSGEKIRAEQESGFEK